MASDSVIKVEIKISSAYAQRNTVFVLFQPCLKAQQGRVQQTGGVNAAGSRKFSFKLLVDLEGTVNLTE